MRTEQTPAKALHAAKNAAGACAVAAAERGDFRAVAVWQRMAVKIDGLLRDAVEEMAR